MNSAPRSTTAPSPNGTDQTRPPTRSRASSTVTSAPRARSASAAASPAKPAPTTTTRVPSPIRQGYDGPMLIVSMGVSIDGFINERDGGFNWSEPDDEQFAFHLEQVRGLGACLLGRGLYESMVVWET